MFLTNKYSRWYFAIVDAASCRKSSGYVEKHHVIPRCLGGTNDVDNVVALTAREHFICHLLLTKMVDGSAKHKMQFALNMMLVAQNDKHFRYTPSSRLYEYARKGNQLAQQQKRLSAETRRKIGDAHRNKSVSPETRRKISEAKTGKPGSRHTAETRAKIAKTNTGKTHSAATKKFIGDLHRGKTISQSAKSKMVETRKQRYVSNTSITLMSPTGEIFVKSPMQSAEAFCKSLGLQYQTVELAHRLGRIMRSGWQIISLTKMK